MNDNEPTPASYEPPKVIEVGDFSEMTRGQYASEHADDGQGAGYWSQPVNSGLW